MQQNLGPAAEARRQLPKLRARRGRLVAGSYDVSAVCNLRCEGCLYFEGGAAEAHADCRSPGEWDDFFASEARRGVTLAYIAGAEPGLVPDRIRAAQRYIPNGVVFTNGTKRLPDDIFYRVHISAWGLGETGTSLRAGDVLTKALANYRGDSRAVCVFTITALNIDQIFAMGELAERHGLPLTFSYFSPTSRYLEKLEHGTANDDGYFRISSDQRNLTLAAADFAAARREIERAKAKFPDTVKYSFAYDDWVTGDELYRIDPTTGIATDCGVRLTGQVHVNVDLTAGTGKCCSSNIDCGGCRAYAMAHTTYFSRLRQQQRRPGGLEGWIEAREVWSGLFLPVPGESRHAD